MGRTCPAFLACVLLVACDAETERGPVEVAEAFLDAVAQSRCDEAFGLYSSATRENIRAQVHRAEREREGPPTSERAETKYCNGSYPSMKKGTARLVRQDGDSAVVGMVFTEGSHLAFIPFLSTPYREWTGELRLVREAGTWKVERQPVPIGPRGRRIVEVGAVDVFYSLGGDPLRDGLQATHVSRVPRERLEAALRDPGSWARALPLVADVETVEADETSQRLRLSFSGWDQPVAVMAKAYGRLVNPQLPWVTLQWTAEGRPKAPVLFTGSWKLRAHHDGTRVTLALVIEPRQWPEGLPEQILSAERIAEALHGLDRHALSLEPAPSAPTAPEPRPRASGSR